MSQHALGAHLVDDSLTILNVSAFPIHSHSNWFIVHPKGKRLSPVAAEPLRYLRERAQGECQLRSERELRSL